MSLQVSSKGNKKASAEHTRKSGRRDRINKEYRAGANNRGDFKNSSAMKAYNGKLKQQNFGTHASRYADLVAAFGRARKGDAANTGGDGIGGGKGRGRAGSGASLSFSAG